MEGPEMNDSERSDYSAAGKIANTRFAGAALEGSGYPDGTAFLASDAPDFAEMLAASVAEHRPVAVIYPDGRGGSRNPHCWCVCGVARVLAADGFLSPRADPGSRVSPYRLGAPFGGPAPGVRSRVPRARARASRLNPRNPGSPPTTPRIPALMTRRSWVRDAPPLLLGYVLT